MDVLSLTLLGLATFAGAMIQAATGFGFAIVAAPVFLAVINSTAAIAILVALHVVQSLWMVPRLWHAAPRWHVRQLVLGAAIGCPIGFAILQVANVRALKVGIGVVILFVTLIFVLRQRGMIGATATDTTADRPMPGLAAGAVSGAMTALLVMPGPPLMIYLIGRGLAKDAARALSLSFFAVCYVTVFALSLMSGAFDAAAWRTVAVLAVIVPIATIGGSKLSERIPEARFQPILLALLLLSGIGAIASAVLQ